MQTANTLVRSALGLKQDVLQQSQSGQRRMQLDKTMEEKQNSTLTMGRNQQSEIKHCKGKVLIINKTGMSLGLEGSLVGEHCLA